MAQQTRTNFKNGVIGSIFTNVYKLIKGNIVRDKFTTLADSAVFPEDGDQPGGFLKIDNDNKVNVAFIKKNVPSGQYLKDNGTWGTVDTTTPAAAAEANAKAYADSLVIGLLDDRGNYDASSNLYPASGGSGAAGAILKGDIWTISVAGAIGDVGDTVRALTDAPAQLAANWAVTEKNLGYVPQNAITGAYTKTFFRNITQYIHTGTTSEVKIFSFLIPAGTLQNLDQLHLFFRIAPSNSAASKSLRLYVNTVDTIPSVSNLIGVFTMSFGSNAFVRNMWIESGNLYQMLRTSSYVSDELSSFNNSQLTSVSFDPSVANYLIVTGQLADAAQSLYFWNAYGTIIRP